MQNPRFRESRNALTGQNLEQMLTRFVIDELNAGRTDALFDWSPSSFETKTVVEVAHRSIVSKKVDMYASLFQEAISKYVIALAQGFSRTKADDDYLTSAGSGRVPPSSAVVRAISDSENDNVELLLNATYVNARGEIVSYSAEEKTRQGSQVASYIDTLLNSLDEYLLKINYSETERDSIRQKVTQKMEELLPQIHAHEATSDAKGNRLWNLEREVVGGNEAAMNRRRSRFCKLLQLAPGEHNPATITTFDDLYTLYEGTQVTREELLKLYEEGITDHARTLHYIIQYVESPVRLTAVRHLLSEYAAVDYTTYEVSTRARVYEAISKHQNNPEAQSIDWQIYALLQAARELFRDDVQTEQPNVLSIIGPGWLSESVSSILRFIADRTKIDVAHYHRRDGILVKDLIRRLMLSLYLETVTEQLVGESVVFEKLCAVWSYLEVPVKTMQSFPGEVHGMDKEILRSELLAEVMRLFSHPDYVRALASKSRFLRENIDQSLPIQSQVLARGVSLQTMQLYIAEMARFQKRLEDANRYREVILLAQMQERAEICEIVTRDWLPILGPIMGQRLLTQIQQRPQLAMRLDLPFLHIENAEFSIPVLVKAEVRDEQSAHATDNQAQIANTTTAPAAPSNAEGGVVQLGIFGGSVANARGDRAANDADGSGSEDSSTAGDEEKRAHEQQPGK